MASSTQTISHGIVQVLLTAGIERIFTLSGNQAISLLAAAEGRLEIVHTRHEAAAVHMADTSGRLTGTPGVAVVSGGPGLGNAVTGLMTAHAAESPLVLISSCAPRTGDGRREFQGLDHAAAAAPFAKRSLSAADPASVLAQVRAALRVSLAGRPGPVHMSIPADILDLLLSPDDEPDGRLVDADRAAAGRSDAGVDRIIGFLREAARPVIFVGPAMMRPSGAGLLDELSDGTGVPVLATESPRGLNDPALGAVREVLSSADAVLLLGKKLDWTIDHGDEGTFGSSTRFFQVDADQTELDTTARVLPRGRLAGSLRADPKQFARALVGLVDAAFADPTWGATIATAAALRVAGPSRGAEQLHAADVCDAIQPWLDDATLICDGGEFGQWAQALLSAPRRIVNGPGGANRCIDTLRGRSEARAPVSAGHRCTRRRIPGLPSFRIRHGSSLECAVCRDRRQRRSMERRGRPSPSPIRCRWRTNVRAASDAVRQGRGPAGRPWGVCHPGRSGRPGDREVSCIRVAGMHQRAHRLSGSPNCFRDCKQTLRRTR